MAVQTVIFILILMVIFIPSVDLSHRKASVTKLTINFATELSDDRNLQSKSSLNFKLIKIEAV